MLTRQARTVQSIYTYRPVDTLSNAAVNSDDKSVKVKRYLGKRVVDFLTRLFKSVDGEV